jgi:hypothetical protein
MRFIHLLELSTLNSAIHFLYSFFSDRPLNDSSSVWISAYLSIMQSFFGTAQNYPYVVRVQILLLNLPPAIDPKIRLLEIVSNRNCFIIQHSPGSFGWGLPKRSNSDICNSPGPLARLLHKLGRCIKQHCKPISPSMSLSSESFIYHSSALLQEFFFLLNAVPTSIHWFISPGIRSEETNSSSFLAYSFATT